MSPAGHNSVPHRAMQPGCTAPSRTNVINHLRGGLEASDRQGGDGPGSPMTVVGAAMAVSMAPFARWPESVAVPCENEPRCSRKSCRRNSLRRRGSGTGPGTGAGLAVPEPSEYSACIMSTQYTIRAIPDAIDHAVRQRARREEKSINAVVVEALARGLELDAKPAAYTDLDELIGTWQEDPEFDRAVADFERIDEDVWK